MSFNGKEDPPASEILLQATARAGVPEGDPLHAVLLAQAELFKNAMNGLALKSGQDHLGDLTQAFEHLEASQREALEKLNQNNEKILRKLSLLVTSQPAQKLKRWVIWSAGGILAAIIAVSFLMGMRFEESSANGRVAYANDLTQKAVALATEKLDVLSKKPVVKQEMLVKPLASP